MPATKPAHQSRFTVRSPAKAFRSKSTSKDIERQHQDNKRSGFTAPATKSRLWTTKIKKHKVSLAPATASDHQVRKCTVPKRERSRGKHSRPADSADLRRRNALQRSRGECIECTVNRSEIAGRPLVPLVWPQCYCLGKKIHRCDVVHRLY